MDALLKNDIEDGEDIVTLRRAGGVPLGLALARAGCSVEAAPLLRPSRKEWSSSADSDVANSALQVVTWWNKNWRDFAQFVQAERFDEALELLGDKAGRLWDQPPLLVHLARIAREGGNLSVARHVLGRLLYLSERGMPKMDMGVFRYAAGASMVDVLIAEGDVDAALEAYGRLEPNSGNAMGHEIQGAGLLALTGRDDEAMAALAGLLVTAREKRKDFGARMREEFVADAPELDRLRLRKDWADLLTNPKAYLKSKGAR